MFGGEADLEVLTDLRGRPVWCVVALRASKPALDLSRPKPPRSAWDEIERRFGPLSKVERKKN